MRNQRLPSQTPSAFGQQEDEISKTKRKPCGPPDDCLKTQSRMGHGTHLWIIRVTNVKTNWFVYPQRSTNGSNPRCPRRGQ